MPRGVAAQRVATGRETADALQRLDPAEGATRAEARFGARDTRDLVRESVGQIESAAIYWVFDPHLLNWMYR